MFQLRRTAFRLLTSQPSSFLSKPRSFATISPSALRYSSKSAPVAFQRRWASSEVEAKQTDAEEPAFTAEEPTPEEQVEDTIHSDNAAEQSGSEVAIDEAAASSAAEPSYESGEGIRTVTAPSVSSPGEESTSRINAAAESVRETVTHAAESVAETARNVTGMGGGSPGDKSDLTARSSSRTVVEPKSTIYIGNLFFDVTENDLVKELSRFGTITKCRLIRDSRGLSKGFGYVDFETITAATKAIETLNQQLFEGRRLAVQYAAYSSRALDNERTGFSRSERPSRPLNPPSKTLFIGNMSFEMTDRDLNALFRGIKNVIDVRVAIDRRTGQPRGFAHADFIDVQSAMDAMKLLETKETYGRKLRLDYSYGASSAPKNQQGADRERGRRSEESGEQREN